LQVELPAHSEETQPVEAADAVAPSPSRGHSWRIGAWLACILLLGGIWLLVRRFEQTGFNLRGFIGSVERADLRWLILSWALAVASYYGRVLRWMVMLRPIAPKARTWPVFTATAIGYAALILLGRAAEFVRPYLIARSAQVPMSSQIGAWLLERIYDTLLILSIFGYALAAVLSSGKQLGPSLGWVLQAGGWFTGVTCSLCLLALLVLNRHPDALERRLRDALGFLKEHHQEKVAKVLRAFMEGISSTRCPKSVFLLLVYSALEWVVIALCYLAVFQAFPETAALSIGSVLVFIGFVSIGSVVQIPGIGGGVQVVSVIVLTEFFGIDLSAATGIALVSWITAFVGIVPFGVLLALREGITWKKIKEMEQESTL
jgi:glycosyltransferase 2 family protein